MNNSFLLCKFSPLTTPDVAIKKKGKAVGSVLDVSDTESVVAKDISRIAKTINQKMGVMLEESEDDDQSIFLTQKFPDSQKVIPQKGKMGKNSAKSPINTSFNKSPKAKKKTPEKNKSDSDSSLLTSSESELEGETTKKSPVKNLHKSPAKSPKRRILQSSSDSSDEEMETGGANLDMIKTTGRKTTHELSESDDMSVVIPVLDKSGRSPNISRAKNPKTVKGRKVNTNTEEESGSESLISPKKRIKNNNLIDNKKSSRKETVESDSSDLLSSDSEDGALSKSKVKAKVPSKPTSQNKKPVDSSDDLSSSESDDDRKNAKTIVKKGASHSKDSMNKTEANKAKEQKKDEESDSDSSLPSSSSEEEEIDKKAKMGKVKGNSSAAVGSVVKKSGYLGKENVKDISVTSKQTMHDGKKATTGKKSDKSNKKDTNRNSSVSEAEDGSSKESSTKSSDVSSSDSDDDGQIKTQSKKKGQGKKNSPSIQKVTEDSMETSKEEAAMPKKRVTINTSSNDPFVSAKKAVNWIRDETKKTENIGATSDELSKDSYLPASKTKLKYDRYMIPEKFELKSTAEMEKHDRLSGTELYIIRTPAEFDITALNNKTVNLDGTPSIFATKDDREYEMIVHPNSLGQDSKMYCMSAGMTEGHVALSGAVHSSIKIVSWYPSAPPVQLQPPAPTKHSVPDNLKPTFKPFGSESPPRTLSSSEPVKKQKKSKGSRKRKLEEDSTQEVTEEEKNPKHSKKKKKKKGKV